MKILITGGHITPALAVIDTIKNHEVIFVGRDDTTEREEVSKRGIKFVLLRAGRFTRSFSFSTLLNLLRIPAGFFNAARIIKNEKPDIILSFGGYLALPIAWTGYLLKIPIYTHEQTIIPGLANKVIAHFAKKIFVSFEEAKRYFPQNKTILTGNPVRKKIFKIIKKPFEINKNLQVIYIAGGALGSYSINQHIKVLLDKLLTRYIVIHQTGKTEKFKPEQNYFPQTYFSEDEIGYIYSVCDLVIGRAGANTFFELIAVEKPSVLIPLPWSANKEQQKHAEIFKQTGCGEIFDQSQSSEELLKLINKVVVNLSDYKKGFQKLNKYYKKDAADTIIKEILQK